MIDANSVLAKQLGLWFSRLNSQSFILKKPSLCIVFSWSWYDLTNQKS